jgi:ABC-type multidrug transport system ATPase subunit
VLCASRLTKSYGAVKALRGADLTVAAGEIVGLLGPNGAGKTTLISVIAGLLRPDDGSVHIDGQDALRGPRQVRGLVGLAPQELGICQAVTVRENLLFFGELSGVRRRTLDRRIDEVSEALGLTALLPRRAGTLSIGQQRRLHTAAALLHRPPLLLLDEPTVGADIHARLAILDVVRRLAQDGCAVCYSTHYLPEVEELQASVAILESGVVIAHGEVRDLVSAEECCTVEMTFDGPAPMTWPARVTADEVTTRGSMLRIRTRGEPGQAIAAVLADGGTESARLRGVDVIRPSLESVYLRLTGHRSPADTDQPARAVDAAG